MRDLHQARADRLRLQVRRAGRNWPPPLAAASRRWLPLPPVAQLGWLAGFTPVCRAMR